MLKKNIIASKLATGPLNNSEDEIIIVLTA